MFTFLFAISAFLLPLGTAFADRITDVVPTNTRALSMGGAGINVVDDSYAAFLNPANLARKSSRPRLELFNAQLEMSEWAVNAVGSRNGNPLSLGSVYKYLEANQGEWVGYRYSFFPNFTSRFFSFGLLYEQAMSAKYDGVDPLTPGSEPMVTHSGYRRVMPTGSLSFRLMKGILKFGYSIGLEHLGVVSAVVTNPADKSLSYTSGIHEGFAVRQVAGTTLTLPFRNLPSFSFVARDLFGSHYFGGDIQDTRRMTFDLAMSHTTYFGKAIEVKLSADWRDFVNKYATPFMRRFFTGAEIRLGRAFFLRGGYGQGYPTAGIGLRTGRTKFDLGWYSMEMGDRLRDDRDQRIGLHITWSLFNQDR